MTKQEIQEFIESLNLTASIKSEIAADIKAESKDKIEEINRLIKEKLAKIDEVKKRTDLIETKMNRPPIDTSGSGIEKKTVVDPTPLIFLDEKGEEHKSLAYGEKLFDGSEDFSIGKIVSAKITGSNKGLNDYEQKALSEGVGATGGFFLSEEVSAKIIDMARNLAVVQQAGALTIPMSSPEMRLVRIISDPTAEFRAEHGEITESEWGLDPVNLKAMSVGVLVRASRELLADAANAGTALTQAMAAAIGLAVDLVGLSGGGVSEPRGLDQCGGINLISLGVNGAALTTFDEFSEACEGVADHNGKATAAIMAPRTHFALDRLKAATTNQPLIPPQSFQDLKKFYTNQVSITDTQGTASTASKAYVGDFKQLLYGIRQNVEIEMTNSGGTGTFKQVESLIRATMRLDVAVLRENHFTKIEGIIPA